MSQTAFLLGLRKQTVAVAGGCSFFPETVAKGLRFPGVQAAFCLWEHIFA